ncbi:MAG: DUF4160 domain-containing protein [Bacteroidales bacterium]|nr:DUF4160 domain-containing protein [Bacteroidales bacterium]
MPLIDAFNGMKIYVYYSDHPPPHLHVRYNEFEMQVFIETGKFNEGELPTKQKRQMKRWLFKYSAWALEVFYKFNPDLK